MNEALLTEREVSEQTNLSVLTLQKWRWLNTGPPWLKLGGAVRYKRSDVDAWLASRTVTPGK